MAGQADIVYPADSLKVEGLKVSAPDQSVSPSNERGGLGGKVFNSPQGKGVGIFAIGSSPGENGIGMANHVKDPKVGIFCTYFSSCYFRII